MPEKVTAKSCLTLPDGRYQIEPNLFLSVRRGGTSRIFFFRYQIAGKRTDLSLGKVPVVNITTARQEAAKCRALIARGLDPKKIRDEAKKSHKSVKFKDYYRHAMDEIYRLRSFKDPTKKTWEAAMRNHILPVLKDKNLDEITVRDVCAVLNPIWEFIPTESSRIRGQLESIFTFAKREGVYTKENPAVWRGNLEAFLPKLSTIAHKKHRKAYSLEALKDQIQKSLPQDKPVHKAFIFGALTATRQREFRPAKWEEIDLEKAVWTIPPERRKDKKDEPFLIPLSRQAVALLKSIQRQGEYVFSGTYSKNRPLANYYVSSLVWIASGGTATMHGCRSTFRDWAARSGINREVAEKCLMHALGSVEASYQRDDLLDQRKDVMQRWADAILPDDI